MRGRSVVQSDGSDLSQDEDLVPRCHIDMFGRSCSLQNAEVILKKVMLLQDSASSFEIGTGQTYGGARV